ncbi:hypothetical protein A2997_02050 [Candidatus Nomurabacteria bacterium RIFCSPLOWO2_01_FULL_36_10b]|uniref:Transglycosylase SLT domain-containing protein n=1 Tax=Candidatus Nomurabacteria bacterium RIFCSPLOWO2_01_FULL_36_10b TaxID=1801766 RepID=A0A1F6WPH3_9BACT|nr:MAG: hypothetical protein A2997_02050 [Candidatus Nomurabacteria bacterium RIFCSPLOWO2_01_FULL_36_10b]
MNMIDIGSTRNYFLVHVFCILSILAFASILISVSILFIPQHVIHAETIEQQKARLERELSKIEEEIRQQELYLSQQKQQTGSIQRDIDIIRAQIKQKKLEIEKKNKLISKLGQEISQKNATINNLLSELEREQASLARILRNAHTLEEYTFTEFLASSKTVSAMYEDLDNYQHLQDLLHDSYLKITGLKEKTTEEKKTLEEKKNSESNVKYTLEQDKKTVEQKEGEKNQLLTVSKTKEKTYEQILSERKIAAAKIRAALFELRGQAGISFGDAYQFAKAAGSKTGVRPAYILAILTQESSLGKNVGTCNRPGDALTWKEIMPGPTSGSWRDDQTVYLDIMNRLGIKPDGQPLSCPIMIGGRQSGWGGAMGPSQFIPTTWKRYESRIAGALGVTIPNPWNPSHAIMATALYVGDLGAGAKTYTSEREAACKYYSGRGCSDPSVRNAFYGDSVMRHATNIQAQIDVLESV